MKRHSSNLWLGASLLAVVSACGSLPSGGSDAGVTVDAGIACTLGTCGGDGACSATTNTCELKTCNDSNIQPDVCAYGSYCAMNVTAAYCYDVEYPSCSNFPSTAGALAFGRNSTGPVIINVTKVSFATDTTFCGATNPKRGKVNVWAYDPSSRLDAEDQQPSLAYYRTDKSTLSIGATEIQNYVTSGQGKSAKFDINFCAPATASSLTIGLAYDNGNGFCFTLQ